MRIRMELPCTEGPAYQGKPIFTDRFYVPEFSRLNYDVLLRIDNQSVDYGGFGFALSTLVFLEDQIDEADLLKFKEFMVEKPERLKLANAMLKANLENSIPGMDWIRFEQLDMFMNGDDVDNWLLGRVTSYDASVFDVRTDRDIELGYAERLAPVFNAGADLCEHDLIKLTGLFFEVERKFPGFSLPSGNMLLASYWTKSGLTPEEVLYYVSINFSDWNWLTKKEKSLLVSNFVIGEDYVRTSVIKMFTTDWLMVDILEKNCITLSRKWMEFAERTKAFWHSDITVHGPQNRVYSVPARKLALTLEDGDENLRVRELKQVLSDRIRASAEEAATDEPLCERVLEDTDEIVQLISEKQLAVEGQLMDNCVLSYAGSIRNKECLVFHLNAPSGGLTVETAINGRICQARSYKNGDPDDRDLPLLDKLAYLVRKHYEESGAFELDHGDEDW